MNDRLRIGDIRDARVMSDAEAAAEYMKRGARIVPMGEPWMEAMRAMGWTVRDISEARPEVREAGQ